LAPLLLRESPGRAEAVVLLIAMTGVAVIFFGNPATDTPGLLIALGSGFGYGALTVALRGLRPVHPFVVAAGNALGSGLLLLPAVAWYGAFALDSRALLLVLVLGLVQFTLPYVLFSWALQRVEAHRASLIVLLETILNPLLTYLLVGEPVPVPTLLGGPLILLGVSGWLLLVWRRQRRDRPQSARAT
jgi:drug/metabolite transporter (DMT)-like permease